MLEIRTQPAAERIARGLAGQRISANAEGDAESASRDVEERWKDYLPDGTAVLRTLREPDSAMTDAGDPAAWERMILQPIEQPTPQTREVKGCFPLGRQRTRPTPPPRPPIRTRPPRDTRRP